MSEKLIYCDYAATTPIHPQVLTAMRMCLEGEENFGNPASLHNYGQRAKQLVEQARQQVADLIGASADEIIFTSGATESNNLAIKGAARLRSSRGRHIVTMSTEHKSVLDACHYLQRNGFEVTYLSPQANGLVNLQQLTLALRPDTILVSMMQVNNETGIVQDIAAVADLLKSKNILLHVDAVQSIGKLEMNLQQLPIDLLSLSAHKIYGPKGIGALYLRKRPRVRVEPLIHGGGHEQGMRSGTLATHQIVGLGTACAVVQAQQKQWYQQVLALRQQLLSGFKTVKNFHLNSDEELSVPHIVNCQFTGMMADAILQQLPIAASTASACQGAAGHEGSYVLKAMGLSSEAIKASIRLSLSHLTTCEEIEKILQASSTLFNLN